MYQTLHLQPTNTLAQRLLADISQLELQPELKLRGLVLCWQKKRMVKLLSLMPGASAAITGADPLSVMGAVMLHIKEMEDELVYLQGRFLNVDISNFGPNANNILETMVACPRGTAGKDFSIQISMGLAGSTKKGAKYTAILSCINWELPWAQIPTSKKAKLFQVVIFLATSLLILVHSQFSCQA
ncbi:unnamed protein product [Cyclocybe aegerita]|uniref:Uncharacterized protein n=1 Tax=Cyclocybe aegerita TaxID=1973307 RepID=A0A8S0XFC2_CYCAE|nr:unnamed protein product [Cyclocybe aegerita]